jgi:hypothetical protein
VTEGGISCGHWGRERGKFRSILLRLLPMIDLVVFEAVDDRI